MRELFRALSELESRLMQSHGVSLNEAMVLCAIGKERVAASTICRAYGADSFACLQGDSCGGRAESVGACLGRERQAANVFLSDKRSA